MSDLMPVFDDFAERLSVAIDGLSIETVKPEAAFREWPVWDSLALLCFLSMVDTEYGLTIRAADLRDCQTVADLHNLVLKQSSKVLQR